MPMVDTSVAVPFFKGAYGGGYPDGSGNAAKLEFRFGTTRPGTPPNTYDNNVSMNCPLGADDALLNLTGGQAISFWAKADQAMQAVQHGQGETRDPVGRRRQPPDAVVADIEQHAAGDREQQQSPEQDRA